MSLLKGTHADILYYQVSTVKLSTIEHFSGTNLHVPQANFKDSKHVSSKETQHMYGTHFVLNHKLLYLDC